MPFSRRSPANDQSYSSSSRSCDAPVREHAARPGDPGDPAGEVDRAPVPVAGPRQRRPAGHPGPQHRELLALLGRRLDQPQRRIDHRRRARGRPASRRRRSASPAAPAARPPPAASSPSRPVTAPSSSGSSVSPSWVKPTRSAKQTATSSAASSRPAERSASAEGVVSDLLAQVQSQHVREASRPISGRERLGGGGEAERDVVLGVALAHEGVGDQLPVRRRELRHRHPEQARDLEHPLLGDPGVEQRLDPLRGLDVPVGVDRLALVVGERQPERAPARCSSSSSIPRVSAPRPRCSARPRPRAPARPAAARGGPRRPPAAAPRARRPARLSSLSSVSRASRASPVEPVEQPLGLEVDRHLARILSGS